MRKWIGSAVAVLVACSGSDEGALGPRDARFVETVVELRRAASESDSAAYEAEKERVLEAAGFTEDDLRAYVEAQARDPARMALIWDSINARLTRPQVE